MAELKEYHLFVPRINDGLPMEEANDDILHWLVARLNDGQSIAIHTLQDVNGSAEQIPDALRRALRYFEPWLIDGKLQIGKVLALRKQDLFEFPRIFSDSQGGPLWYTFEPLTPLLQSLLPKPAFTGVNQGDASFRIQELIDRTAWGLSVGSQRESSD